MYQVMIVDDEAPALRFLQAIVTKYAPDYEIAITCQNAEEALAYLKTHQVDLFLTDISMPDKDGISLALEARALCPSLRMVIISGYAEFEYAQGAIQAAVDDYILKPVTISRMAATLDKIKTKLDQARAAQEPVILSALLTDKDCKPEVLRQFYGEGKYHFAYVRWGNLLHLSDPPLAAATPLDEKGYPFHILQGRNEEEEILYARSDTSAHDFQAAVKAYVSQARSVPTWTLIFSRNPTVFSDFPDFVHKAEILHRNAVVIGRHQSMYLSHLPIKPEKAHISSSTLKKLEYFCQNGDTRYIKDLMFMLATEWDQQKIPQIQVYHLVVQLIHVVLPFKPNLTSNQDTIYRDMREIFGCAVHYGDLMVGIYTLLFDEALATDKRMSPEELYSYAVRFVQEKYSETISLSHVCSEIGISHTYLNRLFRKYGDTSFNAYLTQCRIEGAMKLIREHPDMKIRDVAACVGYEDSSYFTKVFHQVTGQTPSQWAADSFPEGAQPEPS